MFNNKNKLGINDSKIGKNDNTDIGNNKNNKAKTSKKENSKINNSTVKNSNNYQNFENTNQFI